MLSSQNKEAVAAEIQKTAPAPHPKDFIKNPFVLEFLGIKPSPALYEKDFETALIQHLQAFLLEMGRGFSFVARQKRISFDGRDFYIDLVFYHYTQIFASKYLLYLPTEEEFKQELKIAMEK